MLTCDYNKISCFFYIRGKIEAIEGSWKREMRWVTMLTNVREYRLGLWQLRSIFPLNTPFAIKRISVSACTSNNKINGRLLYLENRQCARKRPFLQ